LAAILEKTVKKANKTHRDASGWCQIRYQIRNPQAAGRDAAFSFFNRSGNIGRTIRTASQRLVVWTNPQNENIQTELYDHRVDPDETQNVAAANPLEIARLSRYLPRLSSIRRPV